MEVAGACSPRALLSAHPAGVDAAFPQELAVGRGEGLANGLGDELGLGRMGGVTLGVPRPLPLLPQILTTSELSPHPFQDKIPSRLPVGWG